MTKKQDLYDDEYEPAGFRWMSIAVVVLAVSGFIALAWYAYNAGQQQDMRVEDVLIVDADEQTYRTAPEDKGGATFKHKDKEIYNTLNAAEPAKEKAKLVVTAEEPKRPVLREATKPAPAAKKDVAKKAPAQDIAADRVKSYVSPIPKPAATQKKKPATKVEVPDPFEPVKKAEPAPIKIAKKVTGHSVQLGAFSSQQEADMNWERIRRSHLDVLNDKPYTVIRADLGAKGVYYRLRVAGLANKAQADALCKTLSGRKQPCFYAGKL